MRVGFRVRVRIRVRVRVRVNGRVKVEFGLDFGPGLRLGLGLGWPSPMCLHIVDIHVQLGLHKLYLGCHVLLLQVRGWG